MSIYIRFDITTGRQLETMSASAKPASDWYKAPKDFKPEKMYERIDGIIKAIDQEKIEAELLSNFKREATTQLENLAEEQRQKFVTQGVGKSAVYRQKLDEAQRYKQDSNGTYPILEAEAVARKLDVSALADLVIEKANQWAQIAGLIEAKVIVIGEQIAKAKSAEELDTLLEIDWQLPVQ